MLRTLIKIVLCAVLLLVVVFLLLSIKKNPEKISYGMSFNKIYVDELGLPWKTVYLSILDDLGVKRLRLSAHWPMIEPSRNEYHYDEMDFQMKEAEKRNVSVIFAVGRRLPRWPECHIPDWAKKDSWEDQKQEIRDYVTATVNRYKGYSNIAYWQVENEPYLTVFASDECGSTLDKKFLKEEIDLVKSLDPSRPVLVTDSGNLGLWQGAWRNGDAFGTSVYMYLWNPTLGQVRSVYLPFFYKAKTNLMSLLFGNKKSFLIELSLEPWLLESVRTAPIEIQIERMSTDKFEEIISFAKKTGFDTQYLWGAEWWYFMKEKGHPEYWELGKKLFESPN